MVSLRSTSGFLLALSLAACSSPTTSLPKVNARTEGNGCGTASAKTPCSDDPDPCNLHSGYPGDEYCILPPPEGQGIQIHFGPKSYTDPAEIAKYALNPGDDIDGYGIAKIPLAEDKYYNYVQIRMRPGSHHLINTVVTGDNLVEGFGSSGFGCDGTTTVSSFPGTQNLIRDIPPGGKQAPENVGLGSKLAGNTSLCVNHHAYNFNEGVQLREVWINVWFVDESKVTQKSSPVIVMGGPFSGIAPHSQQTLTQSVTVNGTGRIINMFGHRHMWTDRFAVWHNDELVYDSWHWQESVVFDYDSITKNPSPNPDAETDGATSGILDVNPGDTVKIECDVNNQSDNTLYFGNKLRDAEMCILFGSSVGVAINGGLGAGGTVPSGTAAPATTAPATN